MSTNTKLAEAARRLDDAIKDLPDGCEGWLEPLDERIAELRAALAAQDAEQELPLKERPDFMAGYVAGLADGRRCAERDAAEQAAQAVLAGFVLVPVELLEDAATAIGHFVSDHGWSAEDMQAMDNLDADIARHKANAAPATPSPAPDCED